jgi:hypothetical protein
MASKKQGPGQHLGLASTEHYVFSVHTVHKDVIPRNHDILLTAPALMGANDSNEPDFPLRTRYYFQLLLSSSLMFESSIEGRSTHDIKIRFITLIMF